jgi:hypothetical protein
MDREKRILAKGLDFAVDQFKEPGEMKYSIMYDGDDTSGPIAQFPDEKTALLVLDLLRQHDWDAGGDGHYDYSLVFGPDGKMLPGQGEGIGITAKKNGVDFGEDILAFDKQAEDPRNDPQVSHVANAFEALENYRDAVMLLDEDHSIEKINAVKTGYMTALDELRVLFNVPKRKVLTPFKMPQGARGGL